MELIDDWYKKDTPAFCLLYRGPVCDPFFGQNILRGSYDKDMKPEVLAYYKDYFTKNPPLFDKLLKNETERSNTDR